MTMNDAIRMQISAFVDGELPDNEADLLLRRMGQDADLRRQVAEFLEVGRVMRGEASVPGTERLRERIAAELDEKPLADAGTVDVAKPGKALRPWFGVAVAASVALVALFGLQLRPGVDNTVPVDAVAETAEDSSYTVPQQVDEQLRQYYLSHGASSGTNARLISLRLSEEALQEDLEEDDETADEEAVDETPTQP